ncbi:PulJ/GspJ family protein [Pseudoxanthomonas suwonensis]|jgi:prepilin-type N-terminal cleavage/methylation domain|uniref:PulJ/GspJ family protein n=1 Tax=Pseudoxanthomonas suwonensis TaxID=314722 RepID=UPI000464AE88|nr:prepilin-type N-terminal cleavage/methylation domain-containing protein [Pseudoxanthomonas suwonensis]
MSRRREAGFTLLEAIVAMVIMATCMMALYGWLSANTISVARANAQTRNIADARSALALVEAVNPMAEPRGERELPPLRVSWESRAITPVRPGLSQAGFPTLFDFALYEMDVQVWRDGQLVQEFSLRRAGWVQARTGGLE